MYFVSVHPFLDGNGRTGRILMQDYMLRRGYIPVVHELHKDLDRREYLQMVAAAAHGKTPERLVNFFIAIQLDLLKKYCQ
jgi:Fic family protein